MRIGAAVTVVPPTWWSADGVGRSRMAASSSGGFLTMTYDHPDRSGDAYDSWVESIVDVDLYAEESGWDVGWLD